MNLSGYIVFFCPGWMANKNVVRNLQFKLQEKEKIIL